MKLHRLETLYAAVLLVIFGGIILQAPLSVGFGTLFPSYSLLIKSWKELLMVLLVPIACVLITRHKLWPELMRDWIFRLIVAYVALHAIVSIVLYKGLLATMAGLAIVLLRIRPDYRLRMLIVAAVGAMVVVGFGVLQLFLPADILKYIGYSTKTIVPYLTVDKNHDFIRINSTLRGPNPLGAYVIIVLAALASLLARQAIRLKTFTRRGAFAAMALASLVVLWVSYSRSAYVGALVALGIVLAVTVGRRLPTRWWVIGCVLVFALVGGLLAAKGNSFISNTLLHENPQGGSSVSSNQGHAESLQAGFGGLLQRPFGAGVGTTGSASLYGQAPTIIENQYLLIGHEIGWLGIILFVTLFTFILVRAWRGRRDWLALAVFASGIGLALVGLLLPVWVDDTVSIIWWGLAAIVLASLKTRTDV
jgi:hypothetical protein